MNGVIFFLLLYYYCKLIIKLSAGRVYRIIIIKKVDGDSATSIVEVVKKWQQ